MTSYFRPSAVLDLPLSSATSSSPHRRIMEQNSKLPVRNQHMSKKQFLCCYVIYGLLLVGSLVIGFIQPIPIYKEKKPSNNLGTSLDLHNSKCSVDLYGKTTAVDKCWHHYFKFRHVWTQYFALEAVFNVDEDNVDVGITEPVQLRVTWQG
jgi:hypothetical protein